MVFATSEPLRGVLSAPKSSLRRGAAGPNDQPSTARLGAPPDAPHSALVRHRLGITEGAPVDYHLGTVDVLDDGQNSLVVYSTEITPDELADVVGPSIEGGVQGLKAHLEGGS